MTAYLLSKQQKAKNMKAKLSHGTCPDFWSEKQSRDKMDDDIEEDDNTKIVNSTINRKSGELHLYFHYKEKMYRLHLTGNDGTCLIYKK